jgi:hypothetical protein
MRALLLFTILLIGTTAQAAPRIQKGDWELGGALNFRHTDEASPYFGSTKRTLFTFRGNGQYFVHDGLSAGVELGISTAGVSGPQVQAGPVVTKYIWVDDKLAPYVSMLPIQYNKSERIPGTYATTVRVGAKYFLTDSVAVGPAFEYSHDWGNDELPKRNTFSFLGLFSIHL